MSSLLTQCSSRPVSDAPRLTVGTMEAYRRAFIQTGSLAPLKHVMVRRSPEPAREIALDRRSLTLTPTPRLNLVFVPSLTPATRFPARQAGVFVMAFGMEHYFHHKYHSHAEGAHDHKEAEVDMTKVDAALPAAAAAAMAEKPMPEKPLPADMDALTAEIKSLRAEIGTLRAGMREAAEEANKKK